MVDRIANPWNTRGRGLAGHLAAASLITLLAVLFVADPKTVVDAALAGLRIFLDVVLPSLLPFFILSEFVLGFGLVHFLGVLLEPFMRPLFNVPGAGAFAFSMGLAAGYPMDAVITSRFRKMNMCTRVEGERLLAFTNTADPLFILGAVAVGMFKNPAAGGVLAFAHYLSSFTVGFLFRFYGRGEDADSRGAGGGPKAPERGTMPHGGRRECLLLRAFRAMRQARREDGRAMGKMLNDAVSESMSTLLKIGGFIMLFSVLSAVMTSSGLMHLLAAPVGLVLRGVGLDPQLAPSIVSGIMELDVGTAQAAATTSPLPDRLVVASAIIAWSGLSVFGQVASIVQGADIRMGPYVLARLAHAAFAALYTVLGLALFPVAGAAAATVLGSGAGEGAAAAGGTGAGGAVASVAAAAAVQAWTAVPPLLAPLAAGRLALQAVVLNPVMPAVLALWALRPVWRRRVVVIRPRR